jgi:hypothetical protein
MDATDPKAVARNMVLVRGREAALARLDRYISGDIRSEEGADFWKSVKAELEGLSA